MKKATHLPEFDRVSATGAVQKCYRLSKPLDGNTYVVVSAVNAPYTGDETYIFPADETGKITGFLELRGSYRGGFDHAEALRRAGYKIEVL